MTASTPNATVYAPTAAGLSLLNSMTGLSKTNLGVFEKYVPVGSTADAANPITVNGVNIPNGPLAFASPNYNNSYHAIVSTDWTISNKDQLRARYIYDKNSEIDNNGLAAGLLRCGKRVQQHALALGIPQFF